MIFRRQWHERAIDRIEHVEAEAGRCLSSVMVRSPDK